LKFDLKLILSLFLLLAYQEFVSAQPKYYSKIVQDTILINFANKYEISQINIIPFTETIQLRNSILTKNDYSFQYDQAVFALSDSLQYSIFDTLVVTYQTIIIPLRKDYRNRSLITRYDEQRKDTILVPQSVLSSFSPESIFGANMEKSGTLVRGFTVGNTKDFTLNSGLRLQIAGRLSEEIEIVAALTDENTPIQPTGATERLEELDKVFIQIKHPNAIGTFGDYQIQKRQGEFGVINRKLQGLIGEFNYEGNTAYFSVASSRGKFVSNSFNGSDGVQGPYRLTGISGEREIIAIAGTERVYLDGVEMRRGENNDYVIEYSNAEVTFTPRRLITSASRIIVEFEYTDRRYSRNFFGSGVTTELFNGKVGIKLQYLREGDNEDSPIDISLSEEDRGVLALAGDDRLKATKTGVSIAPLDSLGVPRGAYVKIDTLINNLQYIYYRYAPGDSLAFYNVSFSYIGEYQADYIKESLGNFKFVGIGAGSYAPVILLPLPELKQLGNIALELKPFEDFIFNFEYAGSMWDRNKFSTIEDRDNFGYATNLFFQMNPKEIELGDFNLGKVGLSYKDRFVQSKFTTPDRFNEVEYNRNYNISSATEQVDEKLRELSVNLFPIDELKVLSSFSFLRRGDEFKTDRYNNTIQLTDQKTYNAFYNFDYVSNLNNNLKSDWLRQKGSAYYSFGKLRPGFEFLAEDRKDYQSNFDSLTSTSLKYYEAAPFIELKEFEGFYASAKYSLRKDYFPIEGIMFQESQSTAQFFDLSYSGIREVNSYLNLAFRQKKYTEEFAQKGFLDNETILIRSVSKFNFWSPLSGDLYYEVATQKSARLEKVFIQVEKGTGNYIYLGDLNNNGITDEYEFEPTLFDGEFIMITIPTTELFPVIDLKTSTRWKIEFAKLSSLKSGFQKILDAFASETYWRIEENSTEEDFKKIYLLNLPSFQNEETTIRGFNLIQEDLFIFENNPDLSFRLRYAQTKSMNQYSGGIERAYKRERSLRIRFKLIKEFSNQTDIVNEQDNNDAPETSNRNRIIKSNAVISDFSYRPDRNIEVGFKIQVSRSEDEYPIMPTIVDNNSQTIRFNFSFAGSGRLRIEMERAELIANTSDNFIPYELTGGSAIGKNYYWRLNFDYRLTSNLQSSVNYDGRLKSGSKAINTARAEIRLYF
jgi:hypothetical protein